MGKVRDKAGKTSLASSSSLLPNGPNIGTSVLLMAWVIQGTTMRPGCAQTSTISHWTRRQKAWVLDLVLPLKKLININ